MKTRITEMLGIAHPIIQGGMSWASSSSALPLAVSNAGGLGVVAAGPMRVEDFRRTLQEMQAGTQRPWAVNIPLYNPRAAEYLDLAHAFRAPVLIASQGGPGQLPRFRAIGTKWLHVVTTPRKPQLSMRWWRWAWRRVGIRAFRSQHPGAGAQAGATRQVAAGGLRRGG
jgi:enoyl-[acyl-carrier protein] reductase II